MTIIADRQQVAQFDANMAMSIIQEYEERIEQDRAYYQRIINGLQEENEQEREARITAEERALAAENEKSKLLSRMTKMADDLYLYDLQRSYDRRILANPNLDSSTKTVACAMVRRITEDHNDPHTPVELVMEDIAEEVGVSSSTVGRINKKMSKIDAWDYQRSKPELLANGHYKTTITIALQNIVDHPEQLAFEKHQGGARLRLDRTTGEQLDTVSIDYSRAQDQATLRLLPGQRADLDPRAIIAAIKEDRCFYDNHAHNRVKDLETNEQKQDAFPVSPLLEDDFLASDDQLPTIPAETTATRPSTSDKKQDAFPASEVIQAPAKVTEYAKPTEACTAVDGNSKPCGSTQWFYHYEEANYICRACYSPAKSRPPITYNLLDDKS